MSVREKYILVFTQLIILSISLSFMPSRSFDFLRKQNLVSFIIILDRWLFFCEDSPYHLVNNIIKSMVCQSVYKKPMQRLCDISLSYSFEWPLNVCSKTHFVRLFFRFLLKFDTIYFALLITDMLVLGLLKSAPHWIRLFLKEPCKIS